MICPLPPAATSRLCLCEFVHVSMYYSIPPYSTAGTYRRQVPPNGCFLLPNILLEFFFCSFFHCHYYTPWCLLSFLLVSSKQHVDLYIDAVKLWNASFDFQNANIPAKVICIMRSENTVNAGARPEGKAQVARGLRRRGGCRRLWSHQKGSGYNPGKSSEFEMLPGALIVQCAKV